LLRVAGWLIRYIQHKLGDLDLWKGPYGRVKEWLRASMAMCERFSNTCTTLTGLWKRCGNNQWDGDSFSPESLATFSTRLKEVRTRALMRELVDLR
jgi:hypothetical protein